MTRNDKEEVNCGEILLQLERQGERMVVLESKFDQLLMTIDVRMGQLINILAERSSDSSKTFRWLILVSLLVLAVVFIGDDSVIKVINAIKH